MYKRAFLLGLFLVGCAGAADPGGDSEPTCANGELIVEGPATRIMARYPEASPPERLLQHHSNPGMVVTPEGDGWVSFTPHAALAVGDVVTIETRDYATGAGLCPLETVVERP